MTHTDTIAAFGLLPALLAERKRLMRERDAAANFRNYAVRVDKLLLANRVALICAFNTPSHI